MKKQFVAKLLVLGMALAMLPIAVLAANPEGTGPIGGSGANVGSPSDNDPYDTTPPYDIAADYTDPYAPAESAAPSESVAPVETVDEIKDVKEETREDGTVVLNAKIEVTDKTAPAEVSDKAVDSLIEQAKEGSIVSISVDTTGAVTVPAAKLAALVEKTGNAVPVGNSVATVSVNKALAEAAGDKAITIEPKANEDGTISVPVKAGDKEIDPADIEGGINVEVAVKYTAEQVSNVCAVKADTTEVSLEWSISAGKLQVNLTVSGSIKVIQK